LGFHAATTHWEKRVHVRLSPAPRFCRGICPRVPPRRLRCRSQVFPTSQRPSSSLHRPTIFRWVAFLRFALQGIVPLTKPRRLLVVRRTLLTLLPRADPSPFLGGDTRRRGGSYLGAFIRRLLFVYRVFILVKVDRTHHPFLHSGNVRPAPLGLFYLLMVCTRAKRGGVPPSRPSSFASSKPSLACHPLPSTAYRSPGPTHSHKWTVPSQGFSPATASPVWRATKCGLIGLATFRLGPRYPVTRTRANLFAPI